MVRPSYVRSVQTGIDQAIVAMLQVRNILVEDLLNSIRELHLLDFDSVQIFEHINWSSKGKIEGYELERLAVDHFWVVHNHLLVWLIEPFL